MLKIPFLILICLILGPRLPAQEESKVPKEVILLLRDYRAEFAKAKAPVDKVLESEASKLMAQLIRDNRSTESNQIATQVKGLVSGQEVKELHSLVSALADSYAKARAKAVKPVQDRYLTRIRDKMRVFEGKDMAAVIALGEIENEVKGLSKETPTLDIELQEIPGKYVFRAGTWQMQRELLPDGTVKAELPGTWKVVNRKLRVDFQNGAWTEFDLPIKNRKLKGVNYKGEENIAEKL